MTKEQQLNVCMDKEAEKALEKVAENKEYIKMSFLHKSMKMEYGEERVAVSVIEAIYEWKSRQTANLLYHEKIILDNTHFDLIYWEGIKNVMNTHFNSFFAIFYTKHAVGCCSVRHHLHNIDASIPNVCPCCNCPDKSTSCVLLCNDKDRNFSTGNLYRN